MESLDRPYGDDDEAYRTVEPELTSEIDEGDDESAVHTTDLDDNAHDPAFQAVEEAGGGVSEGFEMAEGQLIENIESAPDADRTVDGFDPEDPGTDVDEDMTADVEKTLDDADPGDAPAAPRDDEAAQATGVYGEPDQVDVTEVVRDPEEEAEHGDDPGAGPGVAFDR
ncbi:MAG: hypothetical protein JWM71_1542 [Solirubrobacteraceae bacterium]|nr:hypothetical protein [Solirubrobacteraceae bacterium]